MKAKEIITDLSSADSIKNLRKSLLNIILEFMANNEIDDRSDAYSTFIILNHHLRQVGKYQKKQLKTNKS